MEFKLTTRAQRTLEFFLKHKVIMDQAWVSERNEFHGGHGERTVRQHTHLVYQNVWDMINFAYRYGEEFKLTLRNRKGTIIDTSSTESAHYSVIAQMHLFTFFKARENGQLFNNAELQLMLALLHDIGKPKCIVADENGITGSPEHETLGRTMMEGLSWDLKREGLELHTAELVTLMHAIGRHGDVYPVILFGKSEKGLFEGLSNSLKAMLLVNTLADLNAGRRFPMDLKSVFRRPWAGFTDAHRIDTKARLAKALYAYTQEMVQREANL